MKVPTRTVCALVMLAFGMSASASAFADGRRGHVRHGAHAAPVVVHGHGGPARFGLYVGAPLVLAGGYWGPRYYYPSAYYSPYYPPVVTVPVSPPTYVEQGQVMAPAAPAAGAAQSGYWYYCGASRTYYPYVRECPGGWQRVSPQPTAG